MKHWWILGLFALTSCVGMAIGDSITRGVCPGGVVCGGPLLPEGGWPEKTARLLSNQTAINRGYGGSHTGTWLAETDATWADESAKASRWTDVPNPRSSAQPFVVSVYLTGSTTNSGPSSALVLVMLGTNDRCATGDTPEVAFARYQQLITLLKQQTKTSGGHPIVIPVTLLTTNTRCACAHDDGHVCDAAWIADFNALLRASYTNEIDLDTEFLARGGTLDLFPDGLHPGCAGHDLIAAIIADTLVARGLASYSGNAPLPCTTP